jgi:hypothetical protein
MLILEEEIEVEDKIEVELHQGDRIMEGIKDD